MTWTYIDGNEQADVLLAKAGDAAAAQRLLMAHQPLLRSLYSRFECSEMLHPDLLQAGNLGVLRAVRHYDPAYDVRFMTYAVPWVLGEMRAVMRKSLRSACSLESPLADGQTLESRLHGDDGMNLTYIDLRIALELLEQDERMVICLRYFRDMTQIETAGILRKSQAQISRLERRALDKLHAHLS